MNIKLNIKSIIKFEQLTDKSFNKIDYTNEDDLLKLLYCVVLENNSERFTLEEFKDILNSQIISDEIMTKFNKELQLIEQFTTKIEQTVVEESVETKALYVKDIAGLLIINAGIDAHFVMNEMSINEIGLFMESYNDKIKQQMESDRLWCYMSILPHIDSSKIASPDKFYPFPWEQTEQIKKEKEELHNMVDELPELFKNGASIIDKINKQNENK